MKFLNRIFGDETKKILKKYEPLVAKINELEPALKALSNEQLAAKTQEFKGKLQNGENLDAILPEAFAVAREASSRTLGQRHFDVQLIGGMLLHNKTIAEMRTGEGKTLVATLPAYLNALTGKGVHVVTVNDYLSRRDAVWMGQIYSFLGLKVAVVNHNASYVYDPNHKNAPEANDAALDHTRDDLGSFKVVHEFLRPVTRREAYEADITYGTNSEFGFDYLRDNLEYSPSALRQRPFYYAIVDEIDSILIDEARTPLIISAPSAESEQLYHIFADIVKDFSEGEDYTVDEKHNSILMGTKGIEKAEKKLGVENIYTDKGIKYVHHLENAVKAKALYHVNKEYVVRENEIVIVDEFTGRMQPGRRWSEGLHQAIEAKESVPVQKETRTFASITYQNYFRLYEKLGGMTGTALTSSEEFFKVYGLTVVPVPTHREIKRIDQNDQIFRTEKGKFKAVARKVKELHKKGQPVLVGTVSIEKNEVLAQFLKAEGIPHEVLNAKNHEREGEIIAQAGKKGGVTIATNMAGRGVDIKLGGNPGSKDLYEEIKSIGGLFVLGTERHEARRIDNQLRGRSGRQGDPGETQFFVSLEDSLMRVFASDTLKGLMGKLGMPEDEPIENRIITRSLETAQTKIEGFNFDSRKHILEYDDVLNYQRKIVYERRRALLLGTPDDVEAKLNEIILGDEASLKVVKDKIDAIGRDPFLGTMRYVVLQTIDMFWVDHLEFMDYLRSSVNLRAYGQRDPLVEYKKEGRRLFQEMQAAINAHVIKILPHVAADVAVPKNAIADEEMTPAASDGPKVGRNDPCYCGSGKKYKHCHGKSN